MTASTLVLNADGTPLNMLPLSTLTWQESITYMILEKVTVLEWHDHWYVRSANWETRVPAVVVLKTYEKKKPIVRYSKRNVFLRDNYICQYCGIDVNKKTATLDHVLPQSHGGKTTYENTVCACSSCNARKGNDKSIRPKKTPLRPTYYQLIEQRKKQPFEGCYPSWKVYLGIDN